MGLSMSENNSYMPGLSFAEALSPEVFINLVSLKRVLQTNKKAFDYILERGLALTRNALKNPLYFFLRNLSLNFLFVQ